jgi:hypothetical protein
MVKQDAPRFTYPTQKWDAKKCLKEAKHTQRDGMGTPYPFKGACPWLPTSTDYNGGTIINGEWYQGVIHNLPKLAKGFKWFYRPTWCWQIVKA